MTTVKHFFRCLVILIVAFSLLASCSKEDKTSAFEELLTMTDSSNAKDAPVQKYRIIYPSGASAELIGSIDGLCKSIQEDTGLLCAMTEYGDEIYENNEVYYIYIGSTERVRSYYDGFRAEDYVFRANEDYAVLGGLTDSSCISAIERFLSDVLGVCEPQDIFSVGNNDFLYRHPYELDSLLLCGLELKFYDAVCTEERGGDFARIAEYTYNTLAEKFGVHKKLQFSDAEDGRHELIFCENIEQKDARISYDGEDITVSAPDAYGLCIAADRLLSDVLSSQNGASASLDIHSEIRESYTVPTLAFGAVLSSFSNVTDVIKNSQSIIDKVRGVDVPFIYLGVIEPSTYDIVCATLGGNQSKEGYQMAKCTLSDGNIVAFAYRASVLKCGEMNVNDTSELMSLTLSTQNIETGIKTNISVLSPKPSCGSEVLLEELEGLSKSDFVLFVDSKGTPHESCSLYCENISLGGSNFNVCLRSNWQNVTLTDSEPVGGGECISLSFAVQKTLPDGFFA